MSRSTWATAALPALLLVAASVLADSPSGLTNSNEHVVWKKGDLAPPLPHDPAARAAAVAQAERNGQRVVAVDARTVTYAAPEERVVVQARPVVRPAGGALPTAPDPAMARWLGDLRSRLRAPGAASNQNGDVPTQVNDPNHRIITTQNESTTLTPTLITSFDGIDDTGLDPGAPDIAAGPDHLVLATTDRITIMDKCGNTLYSDLLRVFAGAPSTAAYYTPRVIYDEWDNRWILVFIGTETNYSNSTVYVMYSTTPDPTGPWTGYALGTAVFAGLKDYPGVAVTPDGVYLTWDRYNLTTFSFESAIIAEIGKTDFYNDGGTTIYTKSLMTNPHDASLAFSIRPAQMHTYGGTMYFVNDVVFGANFLTLWKLTGLPGASVLTGYDVVIGAYTPPSDVMQLDGTLVDTGDCRVLDAVYSAGTLYETHDEQVSASPSVTVSSIDVTSLGHYKISLQPPNNYANAYGAIDVDDNGQVAVVYSAWGGGALNPSLYYRFLQLPPGSNVGGGLLIYGTDSFHSTAQPYRWGPYAGAARDPSDGRKVWIYGMYASNSPANSWATRVGAVTTFAPSNLTVNATASFYYAGGFVGGPFTPTVFPYDLENTGQTTADWTLTNIPSWLTASASSGHLAPGEIQTINLALSPAANALPAGSYWTYLNFQNCTGTGSVSRYISLGIGTDGSCPGAFVPLYPKSATPTLSSSLSGPGMYLTAIEDVHVCAVDVTANLVEAPQLVYARVYEANGNTRGSLVAENSYDLVQPGNVTHAIPLDVTLQACHEYEVSVEFTGAATYDTYNELGLNLPRDIGGVIRLRNASENGSPSSAEAAQIQLVTVANPCDQTSTVDLGGSHDIAVAASPDVGVYVQPQRTVRLCDVAMNLAAAAGTRVTAQVYVSFGESRSYLIADGTAVVSSAFLNYVDIPISAQLVAGQQYDIAVKVDGTSSYEVDTAPGPKLIDVFEVLDGEAGGATSNPAPTLRVGWTEDAPGYHFTMTKPGGPVPPPISLGNPFSEGAFVTADINQEVYELGVYADIPAGDYITAAIYDATGTTRGSLVTMQSVLSDAGGLRWHDVPLTAELIGGIDYDFAFSAPVVNSVPAWTDNPGLPFDLLGVIQVNDAEKDGNAADDKLVHMRMTGCNATATAVSQSPARTPTFLGSPMPNPATGRVRIGYALDQAGPADITIYDVTGRRVARILATSSARPGVAQADVDVSNLASGVYFVRLSTHGTVVSRKLVVTH